MKYLAVLVMLFASFGLTSVSSADLLSGSTFGVQSTIDGATFFDTTVNVDAALANPAGVSLGANPFVPGANLVFQLSTTTIAPNLFIFDFDIVNSDGSNIVPVANRGSGDLSLSIGTAADGIDVPGFVSATGGLVFDIDFGGTVFGSGFPSETFTVNGDGSFFVEDSQFNAFASNAIVGFRPSTSAPIAITTAPIPEPASVAVLGLLGVAGFAGRRRR